MKNLKTLLLALSASLLFTACAGCSEDKSKRPSVALHAPSLDFSAQDSMTVKTLANDYLAAFAAKDYETAADMLYKLENDSIRELNASERKSYLNTMGQLPNYGCKLKGLALYTTNNNRLVYMMQVTSTGNLETEEGVMKFYLNPVLKDGQWYLTLLDMEQEGTKKLFHI